MTTELDNLHRSRQIFKNTILKNRLARLGQEENVNVYIQPIIDEQAKNTDRVINTLENKPIDEKTKEFEDTFSIDFRNIDQSLPKSIRPVFSQDGFRIGAKFIEVDRSKRLMRVHEKRNVYQITQELVDLIKGFPLKDYSKEHLSNYHNLLKDIGASTTKRFKELSKLGKQGDGIQFLPDDVTELRSRLEKLLSAANEGHTNVFNEGMAILKRLLEKKVISKSEFESYSKIFSQ